MDVLTRLLDFQDLAQTVLQFIEEGNKTNLLSNNDKLDEMLEKITIRIIPDNHHLTGDLSKENPFFFVKENQPLLDAIHLFTKKTAYSRVYRVCVLSPTISEIRSKSAFTGILAQSDAIRFIYKQLKTPALAAIAKKSLKELKLGCNNGKVLCVKSNKTVLEALKAMLQQHFNSVAVVDDKSDKLIGSLTFANIQYLFRAKLYSAMNTKVGEFFIDDLQIGTKSRKKRHDIFYGEYGDVTW
jgi:predicted transcriptional regulator